MYQNALVPELVSSTTVAYGSEDFRNLFLSEGFQATDRFLQHMIEGDNGIFLLTGEEGIGKTTALRYVRHNAPDDVVVILHSFRRLDVDNLSDLLGHTLGVKVPMDLPPEARALRYFLKLGTIRSKGKRLLLMLDNVQELHYSGAEMLKALVNMKDKSGPLVSVLLCGKPELNSFLDSSYRWGIHRLIRRNHKIEGFTPEETPGLVDSLTLSNPELEFPLQEAALPTLVKLSEGNPGKVMKLLEGGTQIAHDHDYQSISSRMLRGARSGKFKTLGHISALFAMKALVVCALLLLVPITLFQDNIQQQIADIPPADNTIASLAEPESVSTTPTDSAVVEEPGIVVQADQITRQEGGASGIIKQEVVEPLQKLAQSQETAVESVESVESRAAMQAILDSIDANLEESTAIQKTTSGAPTLDLFNLRIPSQREIALQRLKQFAKPNQTPTD